LIIVNYHTLINIIIIGLPVLLTGTTDANKKFHPFSVSVCTNETHEDYEFIFKSLIEILDKLYQYEYKPNVLIADGAEAITNGFKQAFEYESINDFHRVMCWAHVHRNVSPKINKIKSKGKYLTKPIFN